MEIPPHGFREWRESAVLNRLPFQVIVIKDAFGNALSIATYPERSRRRSIRLRHAGNREIDRRDT